jgi:hypothetical protein
MAIMKLGLIVTATAAASTALPAIAHADPDYQLFQSPSGNIHCELTVNYKGTPYANCTIQQANYAGQVCQAPGLVIPQLGSPKAARQTCRGASAQMGGGRFGRRCPTAKPDLSQRSPATARPRVWRGPTTAPVTISSYQRIPTSSAD